MVKSFRIIAVALFIVPVVVWLIVSKVAALNENKELEEYISQSQ